MPEFQKHDPVIIIGGGPSGLIAAEILAKAGVTVNVYERKASLGRKFLMAGRGGLNLTHSEPFKEFIKRYGDAESHLGNIIENFSPADLRNWCESLGQETFVGSSGRVFPKAMKASPLLRSWIERLQTLGVTFHMQKTWAGWDEHGAALFLSADDKMEFVPSSATLLALGGASWPNLGSDGSWVNILKDKKIEVHALQPANCGFEVSWSDYFREKFAGQPLKSIALSIDNKTVAGEVIIGTKGIEGGAVYAISAAIRDAILSDDKAVINIDLRPQQTVADIVKKLNTPRGRQSFSTYLQKSLNLSPAMVALLREADVDAQNLPPEKLATLIKALPITATKLFPIERAISTAGGIPFSMLDENFMIKSLPGVFAAGEMLDWEAPTGGYLLQATFATGVAAAHGILRYVAR